MIDFACKKFSLKEVIRCGLGITKSEFIVLNFFINNKSKYFATGELSKQTSLDVSTIQRAVKKLYGSKTLARSQLNLKDGGYKFVYKIKSREEIKAIILSLIENWSKRVENEFDNWA